MLRPFAVHQRGHNLLGRLNGSQEVLERVARLYSECFFVGSSFLTIIDWKDDVWICAYAVFEKVKTSQRPQPTIEEFLAVLPAMQWPV